MMSESTFQAANVCARPIDVVAVKGRVKGVRVYEPLAKSEDAEKFAAACARALDAYLARDFDAAAKAWDDALAMRPSDEASKTMKARALEYAKTPPPADWNGAHVMTEK